MSDIIQQEYGANLELVFFIVFLVSTKEKRFSLQDKYNKPIQQNNENNSFPSMRIRCTRRIPADRKKVKRSCLLHHLL